MAPTAAYAAAFTAGFLFGLSDVMVRLAVEGLNARQMLFVSLAVGSPLLWALGLAVGEDVPSSRPLLLYAAAGLLNFAVGRLLFYVAVAGLGAGSASVVTSPTVVLSGVLAWLLLGEQLTGADAAGLAMVSLAVYTASRRPSGRPLHGIPRSLAVAAGLAASLAFASSSVLVRAAGAESGSAILGIAISYTAALPIAAAMAAGRGGLPSPSMLVGTGWGRAALTAALVVALAQACRYEALALARVVEAVVLISLFPIHTVALAALLLKGRGEDVRPRHAVAAVLAVAGVVTALAG